MTNYSLVNDGNPIYRISNNQKDAITDSELLSLIIGNGVKNDTISEISKAIMSTIDNDLVKLSKLSFDDLLAFPGIKHENAAAIIAAFELAKRLSVYEILYNQKVTSSMDAYKVFKAKICDFNYEEFWIILLNKANIIIQIRKVGEGGISGVVVDPKKIFKMALDCHASSIILGHNHPSNHIQPSEEDSKITKKLVEAGRMLDMAVLDHIIAGSLSYYSFADQGTL